MTRLLDTHALLWWLVDDPRLSSSVAALIDDPGHEFLVSAASAWEICTKHRAGKLPTATHLSQNFPALLRRLRFAPLSISVEHARLAGRLPGAHKDPFDRMLAAQSLIEGASLVTNDPAFAAFGVTMVW